MYIWENIFANFQHSGPVIGSGHALVGQACQVRPRLPQVLHAFLNLGSIAIAHFNEQHPIAIDVWFHVKTGLVALWEWIRENRKPIHSCLVMGVEWIVVEIGDLGLGFCHDRGGWAWDCEGRREPVLCQWLWWEVCLGQLWDRHAEGQLENHHLWRLESTNQCHNVLVLHLAYDVHILKKID